MEQDSPPPPPAAWAGGLDTRFKPLSKGSELYLNVLFYFSFLPHSLSMSFQKNMRHKNSDIISCHVHRKLPKIVTLSTYINQNSPNFIIHPRELREPFKSAPLNLKRTPPNYLRFLAPKTHHPPFRSRCRFQLDQLPDFGWPSPCGGFW